LEIAESKQYNVKEKLIRIASKIMNEEEIMING
jgi:glycine betaine/choline ABC-type transport system substrate-binding protein